MNRIAWTIVTLSLAVISAIVMSHDPWKEYQNMRNSTGKAVKEAQSLETEHAQILHESARVDSPTGMEEIAREHGYRQRDETPIQLNQ